MYTQTKRDQKHERGRSTHRPNGIKEAETSTKIWTTSWTRHTTGKTATCSRETGGGVAQSTIQCEREKLFRTSLRSQATTKVQLLVQGSVLAHLRLHQLSTRHLHHPNMSVATTQREELDGTVCLEQRTPLQRNLNSGSRGGGGAQERRFVKGPLTTACLWGHFICLTMQEYQRKLHALASSPGLQWHQMVDNSRKQEPWVALLVVRTGQHVCAGSRRIRFERHGYLQHDRLRFRSCCNRQDPVTAHDQNHEEDTAALGSRSRKGK